MRRTQFILFVVLSALVGCETAGPRFYDYGAYVEHKPRSILVLPPTNRSAAVDASDLFLCTVSKSLAERGYYVFPVAVVDRFLEDNGAPTPGDMHRVPLDRLHDVFGADAVLYIDIEEWTTTYIVLATATSVRVHYRLVDLRTGTLLWEKTIATGESSTEYAQQDAASGLFSIVVAQVFALGEIFGEPAMRFAREANQRAFNDAHGGLLLGPHHPNHDHDPLQENYLAQAEIDRQGDAIPSESEE